jgi:4-amino-4-deoxy-L-arabinose transferase-like glycosyltransferase
MPAGYVIASRQNRSVRPDPGPLVRRPVIVVAAVFAVLEIALSTRYGYHRDELYFIAIGGHLAFGYVDQPPLIPMLAHGLDVVGGHSLLVLRLPSALAGAAVIVLTGMLARELGAGRAGQVLAAISMAVSGVLLAIGHLMSTTTFDVLCWTALSWLVIRALRTGGPTWLAVGAVAGVALEIKTLPAFFLFALLVGVLVAGPRRALADRWLAAGAIFAALLWLPNLVWQASHGWPQLTLARAIANGSSGTSQPRWALLPTLLLIAGPPLLPVWLAGLARLVREAAWRFLGVAFGVLVVIFLVTDGKPYYLAGMYPVVFAAGAEPALRWASNRARRRLLGAALAVSALTNGIVVLPVVPARYLHDTPIVAMNYDAGETVGWPRFADAVAAVARAAHAPVVTANYGEAGALLRYRPDAGPVYGTQNSMWALGRPSATTIVAVGYRAATLRRWFASVAERARIDNGLGVDNDEQGRPVYVCSGPQEPWPVIWRQMKHYS